jgi:hypothetical protein
MLKLIVGAILAASVAVIVSSAASAGSGGPTFSNQILRAPADLPPGVTTSPPGQSGDSEPAIDFGGPDNTMAGMAWVGCRSRQSVERPFRRYATAVFGPWTRPCPFRAKAV